MTLEETERVLSQRWDEIGIAQQYLSTDVLYGIGNCELVVVVYRGKVTVTAPVCPLMDALRGVGVE